MPATNSKFTFKNIPDLHLHQSSINIDRTKRGSAYLGSKISLQVNERNLDDNKLRRRSAQTLDVIDGTKNLIKMNNNMNQFATSSIDVVVNRKKSPKVKEEHIDTLIKLKQTGLDDSSDSDEEKDDVRRLSATNPFNAKKSLFSSTVNTLQRGT